MKETFKYYIDAIVYAVIFAFSIKILELLKIDFNYIYVIIFTLIIFIVGKMILRRFVYKRKGETNK
ncbi:MAG TPA: hypothetical protein VFC60_01560 [Tissierellaceae bacterium]|nr:hypothetical protein [Tissierellaceae bacterium]